LRQSIQLPTIVQRDVYEMKMKSNKKKTTDPKTLAKHPPRDKIKVLDG